jgi:hypothetical protein
VRIHGPESVQDILLVSGGRGRFTKYLFVPTRRIGGTYYSSGLPYRLHGRRVMLGAVTARRKRTSSSRRGLRNLQGLTIELQLATTLGRWNTAGSITVGERLPLQQSRDIRFNPWNAPAALRPAGFINRLRKRAYPGSQAGRRRRT